MTTWEYLKRHAYYYFYAIAVVFILSMGYNQAVTAVSTVQTQALRPTIIIDPGHGGMDGGTTSCTGRSESTVNLEISLRLRDLMSLLGYDTAMTRSGDVSLGSGETIRAAKTEDLKKRVALVNESGNAILLSIHQNHFTQSRYSGPQVFYAAGSQALAEMMQTGLNTAAGSSRSCKKSDGVYLMEHISTTGILIECGFLSNPVEEARLREPEYQKRLSAVIAAVTANYVENGAAS